VIEQMQQQVLLIMPPNEVNEAQDGEGIIDGLFKDKKQPPGLPAARRLFRNGSDNCVFSSNNN